MRQIEYVTSALGMSSVFQKVHHTAPHFPDIARVTAACTDIVMSKWREYYPPSIDPMLSALYNGFTEEKFLKPRARLDNLHMCNWYSDSGGLQLVTAGREVTPDVMKDIYRVQSHAEYAMCFDVIPLRTVTFSTSRNERVNTNNKIFDRSRLLESARATGANVKEQCTYFREHNAKTKVIIIAQGNTPDDMVEFYSVIQDMLSDEDLQNIGGIAVADTCMGNEVMESIDMLIAAHRIAKIAPDSIKRHLHLLGIGAISRMKPMLYLAKSGFLETYDRISYDSSTHTSAHMYGWMKLDGQCVRMGEYRNAAIEGHARNIYRLFHSLLEEYGDEEWYVNHVFFDDDNLWHYPLLRKRAIEGTDKALQVATCTLKWMYILYQVENFGRRLYDVMSDETNDFNAPDLDGLHLLREVRDLNDMDEWKRLHSYRLTSKRIHTDDKPRLDFA